MVIVYIGLLLLLNSLLSKLRSLRAQWELNAFLDSMENEEVYSSTIFSVPDSESAPSAPTQWVSCYNCSLLATMLCPRCRSARYCSQKCQIIHWSRGHKEECHTLTIPHDRNMAESYTKQKEAKAGAVHCDYSPAPSAPPITQNPGPSGQTISSEGSDTNSSETVTLLDPDTLICPICFENLSIPVYQCKNGHFLCSICCTKVKELCPSCKSQSKYYRCHGMEKILESAKVVCPNKKYGCEKIIQWLDRSTHERSCLFLPCCCPIKTCDFLGTTTQLSAHIRREHIYVARFSYNQSFHSILSRGIEFRVLIEEKNGDVFILYNQRRANGYAFSVSVIGQKNMRERFFYKLKVNDGGYTQSIKGPPDIVQSYQVAHAPTKFLLVPDSYFHNVAAIRLKLYVRRDAGKTLYKDVHS